MKIKIGLIWIVSMLGIIGLNGCTSLNSAVKSQGSGQQVVYKASFEEVWAAIPDVITNVGLHYVSVNTEKHVFLAKGAMTGWSWGENVAVFVEKVEEKKTSVEVISKRKLKTNIAANAWDGPIFIQLDNLFKRD